ncbi:MAG: DUF4491 family protein [Tenuifilaceae bacterium]|jgi:hypothetical protein|nr:DUF4491 family protein [Tenuifilaceae bacterium]
MLNITGIVIGVSTIAIIWFGRYACIAGEYHFSKKLWIAFLAVGLAGVGASFFISNTLLSAITSILGFTFLWGIHEIIEQEERVNKGWFPRNPKREK